MSKKLPPARWQSNIKALIEEQIQAGSNGGALIMPWKVTFCKLLEIADAARRINDPELNLLMCELALYTVGDGYHKDYDPEVVDKVRGISRAFKDSINEQ